MGKEQIPEKYPVPSKQMDPLTRLRSIVASLRKGCPWDREQTHSSLRPFMFEELYEVLDAIDAGDMEALLEELGDLLLHVFLHARIAEEHDAFTIEDIARRINEKLIRRHPHVFADVEVQDSEEVIANWEKIKESNEGKSPDIHSVFERIPKNSDPLTFAFKAGKVAAKWGFDWQEPSDIKEKVLEELHEMENSSDDEQRAAEFGDLLFTLCQWSRHQRIHPADALVRANRKFIDRFQRMVDAYMDGCIAEQNAKREQDIRSAFCRESARKKERLWEEIKRKSVRSE